MKRFSVLYFTLQIIFLFAQQQKQDSVKNIVEKQIEEVEIIARKKLIERKIDRLIFNVENSISATGGDALDAIKITPGLRLQNDQISIIGKSEMSIMIEDKLLHLSGEDLISFLKSIRADDIKSIEVITNPPAKYDAEGNSGIVNIILKKNKENRISGNFKTSITKGRYYLGDMSAGLNYQKEKLKIASNINYNTGRIAPYKEYTIYYPKYTWFETNDKINHQKNANARFAVDYNITTKTTLGFEYSGTFNNLIREGNNTSYAMNDISVLDSIIITPSLMEIKRNTHALNLHAIKIIDTLGTKLSMDLDYFKFESILDNMYSTNSYLPSGIPISSRSKSAQTLSNQHIEIYSYRIDYDIPMKWANISLGGKLSFIDTDSNVFFFDTTYLNSVFDPSKSDIFNYKENTQAVYISGNKNLSENWDLQLGVRVENTQNKGLSRVLNYLYKNKYIKFFPTFYLTYQSNENSIWALNYNKRIKRPSYNNLNPFRSYTSSYNYSEGNPFLQPFYSDNIELSHTFNNLYSSIYLNYIKNGFDQITSVNLNNPFQIVKPYNFYSQYSIGINESYVFNKFKFWESNNQSTIYYSKTQSKLPYIIPNISNWTFSYSSTNTFDLLKKIKAELNFFYQSASLAGSYKLSSFYYFDIGLKARFLNDKLQMALNLFDVFKTYKQTFTQTVNNIKQSNYDYQDSQKIRFSLTYNFGKALKAEKRIYSNDEERSRAK